MPTAPLKREPLCEIWVGNGPFHNVRTTAPSGWLTAIFDRSWKCPLETREVVAGRAPGDLMPRLDKLAMDGGRRLLEGMARDRRQPLPLA